MAVEKGRAFLLKIGDGGGPETFDVVGGMRSTSLRINNETVDVTNKTSGGWRELLSGAEFGIFRFRGAVFLLIVPARGFYRQRPWPAVWIIMRLSLKAGQNSQGLFR